MTATSDDATAVDTLVDTIKPLLAGKPPQVQGVALVELVTIWLLGFPADQRSKLLTLHFQAIREYAIELEVLAAGNGDKPTA